MIIIHFQSNYLALYYLIMLLRSSLLIFLLFFTGIVTAQDFTREAIAQDIELYGEWIQGGVIRGEIIDASVSKLRLNDKKIDVLQEGSQRFFIFGFGRDAKLKQKLSYQKNNQLFSKIYKLTKRDYKIQRINGLPKSKVSVDEKHLDRIYKEYALSKKARAVLSQHNGFNQVFSPPLYGIITGVYGSQRILNGKPRRPHFGIDVAAATGTPVYAPASGIVTLTHDNMFFSGGTLIVDHGLGLSSTFIHLHKILVKNGQEVKQGQIIAEVGATGRVTGAHLDWRMNWFDQRVDPTLILSPEIRENFLQNKPPE